MRAPGFPGDTEWHSVAWGDVPLVVLGIKPSLHVVGSLIEISVEQELVDGSALLVLTTTEPES